jgi:hypothetical protein
MNTSDERAVAQLAADLLSFANVGPLANNILAAAGVSGLLQLALAGDDADLKLPAIVVSALFEGEARALKKDGKYGGHYRVEIELRGLRTAPAEGGFEAILAMIEAALQAVPSPLPQSAAVFSYYYIDERLTVPSDTGTEARDFKRSWSVFALLT